MTRQVYSQFINVRQASVPLLESFFIGGFECSSHRTRSGKRLDLVAATAHDRHAVADYTRLCEAGIYTAREGLRWHLIEKTPGNYDFSSALPILRAARDAGVQVVWDLCHYGWPDDIDIFKPEFARRLAHLALAFARVLASETDALPLVSPINEISFFSWAAGEVGHFYPLAQGRGNELKMQLVRAAIEGIEALWDVNPRTRIVHVDPVINVIADPTRPQDQDAAETYRQSQYSAWDMLCGRSHPQLGGEEKYLDIMGLNYYVHNQWIYPDRTMISLSHPQYRPFRHILREVFERYRRPIFIAETGIEDDARPGWLRYIGREVRATIRGGVPVEGVTLYPIVNHPGWEDDRHCHNGLWDYADEKGEREIYRPLADELRVQQQLFAQMHGRGVEQANVLGEEWGEPSLLAASAPRHNAEHGT